ncbi:MAG: hypothetical protein ACK53V_18980, partial [Planctomycetota bacterium]
MPIFNLTNSIQSFGPSGTRPFEITDSVYEYFAVPPFNAGRQSLDYPYSPHELESALRPYDADTVAISSRLSGPNALIPELSPIPGASFDYSLRYS